jgi:opacity protein-like surface antigen
MKSEGAKMNTRTLRICFYFTFFMLSCFTPSVLSQDLKIRVTVEGATVKLNPGVDEKTIAKPTAGTVFTAIAKDGEWYEVKIHTEVGISITGYINEIFVQKVDQREAAEMKPRGSRIEFALSGAYVDGYTVNKMTYSDIWKAGMLAQAVELGTISPQLDKSFGVDAYLNYFFNPQFGFQGRIDYNLKTKTKASSESIYEMAWQWIDGTINVQTDAWPNEGSLSLTCLSANLVFKMPNLKTLVPFVSGGITYYFGKASLKSNIGYGWTWATIAEQDTVQLIDYLTIPAAVSLSYSSIGMNVGGGLDINLSPHVAITLAGHYFYLSEAKQSWTITKGEYSFNTYDQFGLRVEDEIANSIQGGLEQFQINPTFFKASIGLKYCF